MFEKYKEILKEKRDLHSLPLFSTGAIKPLIFHLYLPGLIHFKLLVYNKRLIIIVFTS